MMKIKDPDLCVVIMAGGAGTRFWPLSTEKTPKQFLKLFGERTLLQMSYDRISDLVAPERVLVLTNEDFLSLVRMQLPEIPAENIIGEPMRRDTAAAIALSALLCKKRFGNPVMAVLTADHLIEPTETFQGDLLSAVRAAAEKKALYTFGVRPTYPATGYGYLEIGETEQYDEGIKHYRLACFKEKPCLEQAKSYVESGKYLWNSGMFAWSADTILEEMKKHLPCHLKHLSRAVEHDLKPDWRKALREAFEPLERTSIDFGVMEKASVVYTVASDFSWNDVGGWLSLEEFLEKDAKGNAHNGRIEVCDAASNIIFSEDEHETVALIGVDNLVVVRAGNRTLIVDKNKTEEIKKLVAGLDSRLK